MFFHRTYVFHININFADFQLDYILYDRFDCGGNDIMIYHSRTIEYCAQQCTAIANCVAFLFRSSDNACIPKHTCNIGAIASQNIYHHLFLKKSGEYNLFL